MLSWKIVKPFLITTLKVISVGLYLFTIFSAFGGRINPVDFAFASLMCLAFPYLAILTIISTIAWGIAKKIFFAGAGVLTILVCLSPFTTVFPFGFSKTPT